MNDFFALLLKFFMQYTTQLLCAGLVFFFSLKRRENFFVKMIFVASGFLAIPYIRMTFGIWLVTGWFMWSFFLEFIFFMLLLWYCFDISLKEMVFYGTAVYAMQHFGNAIVFSLSEILQGNAYLLANLGVYACVYLIFYLLFGRMIKKNGGDLLSVKNVYVMAISAATVTVVYILSMWALVNRVNYITRLYAMCCCLLLLFIQFGMLRFSRKIQDNKRIKELLSLEHEQHTLSKESIELINMKCHDLKHQIAALRNRFNDSDFLSSTLEEMEKRVMIYDSTCVTGSQALDIILTEKKLYCEKYRIKFSCLIDGERLKFISEEDICSLFGNILDNAIESVKNCEDVEKRVVSLNVMTKKGLLVIHSDNYCEKELKFSDGLPVTTKDNGAYHGYGLRSVRFLTDKYGGTLSVKLLNKIFNLNVLIPIKESNAA